MGSILRSSLAKTLSQVIEKPNVFYKLEIPSRKEQIQQTTPVIKWTLNLHDFKDNKSLINEIKSLNYDSNHIQKISLLNNEAKKEVSFVFHLETDKYIANVLSIKESQRPIQDEHLIFEFSSPNIAKPFHVGHLRSTIIGNVLSNLHSRLGYKVTNLNYLGDWGTQFGMLQIGVEMLQLTEDQMLENPIENLYQAYVVANQAALTDASIEEKARKYFSDLENNANPALAKQWTKYRSYTINDLEKVYQRLGVHFDDYEWESQYSQKDIKQVINELSLQGLLLNEHDGRKVVNVENRRVPVVKSDGTTLYLLRDVAAILSRFQRYQFNRIYYIVENGQNDHFKALFTTVNALEGPLNLNAMKHIKFGRIHGMSTRKGQAVFLKDVLNEARDIMYEKQIQSPTTKLDLSSGKEEDVRRISDILGVSAVVINDLKQRRQRDYEFSWEKALQVNGDTGIKLQYTHCRLHSLLENLQDNTKTTDIVPQAKYLQEKEAMDLVHEIARYEQYLWQSKEQLEACILVNYLFSLCNATSKALKVLNVKNESNRDKQMNRLVLFEKAKIILNEGMCILGLKPLNKM